MSRCLLSSPFISQQTLGGVAELRRCSEPPASKKPDLRYVNAGGFKNKNMLI